MTINQIHSELSEVRSSAAGLSPAGGACSAITALTAQLTASLRRPTRRTLSLINKALSYLHPFESPLARPASPAERRDLLDMAATHRLTLSPYIDIDRIESHLRHPRR